MKDYRHAFADLGYQALGGLLRQPNRPAGSCRRRMTTASLDEAVGAYKWRPCWPTTLPSPEGKGAVTEYFVPHRAGPDRAGGEALPLSRPCLAGGETRRRPGPASRSEKALRRPPPLLVLPHPGGGGALPDDGEPQGTAGQPMLSVFQREGVTNVCCVVTRYFGGILLGAGGWCGPIPSPPRTPWTRRVSPWCAAGWRVAVPLPLFLL